LLMPLT